MPDKVIIHVVTNNVKDDNPKRVKVKIGELIWWTPLEMKTQCQEIRRN